MRRIQECRDECGEFDENLIAKSILRPASGVLLLGFYSPNKQTTNKHTRRLTRGHLFKKNRHAWRRCRLLTVPRLLMIVTDEMDAWKNLESQGVAQSLTSVHCDSQRFDLVPGDVYNLTDADWKDIEIIRDITMTFKLAQRRSSTARSTSPAPLWCP